MRATVRLLSTLVAAALLGLSAVACATTPAAPPPGAAPTTGSEPDALPALRDIAAIGASTIKASPSPDWAVAAAGSVWVAGVGPGLQRYDATTGAMTGEVAIYSVCSAMDRGFGSIWAMSSDAVWVRGTEDALAVRIDPQTNAVVDRLGPLAGSGGVAVTDTSVWLTARDVQSIWRLPE